MLKSEESVNRIGEDYTVEFLDQKDEEEVIDLLTRTFTVGNPIYIAIDLKYNEYRDRTSNLVGRALQSKDQLSLVLRNKINNQIVGATITFNMEEYINGFNISIDNDKINEGMNLMAPVFYKMDQKIAYKYQDKPTENCWL